MARRSVGLALVDVGTTGANDMRPPRGCAGRYTVLRVIEALSDAHRDTAAGPANGPSVDPIGLVTAQL